MRKEFKLLVVVVLALTFAFSLSFFASAINQNLSAPLVKGPSQTGTGQSMSSSSVKPPVATFTYTPDIPHLGDIIVL